MQATLPKSERLSLALQCVQLRDDPDRLAEYVSVRNRLLVSMLGMLRQLAFQKSNGSVPTEDLVSEAMIAAIEAINSWDPQGGASVSTWCRRQAEARILSILRSTRSTVPVKERDAVDQTEPVELAIRAEEWEAVCERVQLLSETERQIVVERYGLGCRPRSVKQIAESLGCSRQWVHELLMRALSTLASGGSG